MMISGFTIGMFVTVSIAERSQRRRSLLMPTAAAVPMAVDTTAAQSARMRVFLRELRVTLSLNSSAYHLREAPSMTERLFAPLKENTMSMAMGAKRKMRIIAV